MGGTDYHITATVLLRNSIILKDDAVVFRSEEKGAAFLKEAYGQLGVEYPRFYKMDALSKMGLVAADVLLKNNFTTAYRPEQVGLVFSNRNASIEADAHYWEASQEYPSPALFVYTLPNIVIGELCIRYQFKGENAFFVSERFDAEWIHWYVSDLMKRNLLKACICGWVDVLDDRLDACLFLVEQEASGRSSTFTPGNLDQIYKKDYGK
ncbi:MAG: hypothetical protein J7539_01840 [Niabella sp.]|nr:hypothetical protein [Niabella sp.]